VSIVLRAEQRRSQVVQVRSQLFLVDGFDLVLCHVLAELSRVHADHGHLDRPSKVEVVEEQMIYAILNLELAHPLESVLDDLEQDRLHCGYSRVVRDKVELVESFEDWKLKWPFSIKK
jgi:hypothetical protein